MTELRSPPPSSGHAVLRLVAFAVFGVLAAGRFTDEPEGLVAGAAVGALAGIFLLSPLRWILWLANPSVRKTHDYGAVRRAVGAGFATIVPFAVLALVAESVLDWDALTAFALAGMMAGSGAAGIEVSRLGGRPAVNLLLGVAHGFGLVVVWTAFMVAVWANV